ncbi:hypothetical protein BJ878DRAFT_493844 [Calycina marina]|uniref:Uncharacterized protein n=1 Tax=Calycina marina TaxID=1763456 RepID=A0A9P7Z7Q8_9HELO|nr:hypothetical protein BJ878DRAFT_493844 [Calycina marina]
MSIIRSSGKQESSTRTSRESTYVPMNNRQRSATLIMLDTSRGQDKGPMTAATDDSYAAMSAPGILDNISNMSSGLPASDNSHKARMNYPEAPKQYTEHFENDGNLNTPAPIGKQQPSWDAGNTTPIMEEEAFHSDSDPVTRQMDHLENADSMNELARDDDSRLPREYESSKDRAWVMVSENSDLTPPKAFDEPPKIPDILTFDSHFCMNNDEDSTPTVTQHDLGSLDVKHEDGARISSESGRERAPSILDRPRYSYDVIRADVPNGPNPSATSKQIEHNPASIPPIGVAAISSFPSGRENYESRPVAGPRKSSWTAAQHEPQDRPRYSYDVPRADPFLGRSASRNAQSNHGSPVIDTAIAPKSQHADPEPSTASSFKGLPSFRRSSTFGFGFNTRAARQSADAKNEEPVPALLNQSAASSRRSSEVAIAAGVATPEGIANRDAHRESFQHEQDLNRALPTHVASLIELPPSSQHPYTASAAFDPEGVQRSQDSWRPQAVTPTDQELRGRWADSSEPRPSYEQQPRIKEFTRLPSYQVSKLGDQPPSSAQRYPNLFRGGQDIVDDEKDGDLPAHYYQPPIPREETFLPRQQTNEYQLSGVGPPDESRPAERPNSLVRDIANKIRSASRKRRNSVSSQGLTFRRHDTQGTDYAESNVTSNDGQDQTKRKRTSFFGRSSRSSINERPETRESTQAHFAGSMRSRGDQLFTPGQSPITGPDKTHVFFGEERPPGVQIGNIAARASMDGRLENQGKKKPSKRFSSLSSMFARSKDGAPKSTMMGRAHALSMSSQERRFTTSHIPEQRGMPPPARAKAGGGFFARLSTGAESALSPQPKMRKSTTNPALAKKILGLDVTYNPDNGNQREERAVKQEPPMKKPMPTSGLLSGFKGEPSSTSKEAKTRKSSTAELLSALMGQKSQHGDKQEDSSSQRGRSTGEYHPSQQHTHVLPQKASPGSGSTPQQQQMMYLSFQGNEPAPQENPRGRRESRQTRAHMRQAEPTYDAVPIPGGYDFVRGEGSLAAPRGSAQYQQPQKDPRLSRQVNLPAQRDYRLAQQQDPRYTEQQDTYDQNSLQQNPRYAQQDDRSYTQQSPSVARQSLPNSVIYSQYIDQKSTPSPSLNQSDRSSQGRQNLGTDSPNGTQRQSTPRINRDDLIARSPARAVIGQQRPYQLSLPEDPDDHKSISIQKSIPLTSPPSSTQSPIFPHPKNKAIEGHGRPTLRHHESPASYPLLDDTVFSPINPSASTLTPPPPPKWPASMDNKDDPHLAIGTSIGVGRSNTWATAASGVSQMSVEKAPGMLVPNASGADRTAHSPTPPSPSITPPLTSHQPPQQQQNLVSDRNSAIKQTTLTRAQSPDLYDASPRLPKPVTDTETERERLRVQKEKDMKSAQEEKIFWDKERGEEGRGDDVSEEPVMTATSFPGQGWDPYIYGDGEEY